MTAIKTPKKLIEVALPLDAINAAAAREKSIRHGHPSTLHLWWARRPLAAARAVLFAQMVNDPGYQQGGGFRYGVNKEKAALERERLFKIIEELVQWENTNNEEVLERARAEIRRSWRETCELNKNHPQAAELFNPDKLPGFHDPFAGGGAIPLEAQRLGLESWASDLNPVAVTINKALIEIPPRFSGRRPIGPIPRNDQQCLVNDWAGPKGLAEDVRRYGAWIRSEAYKRIGQHYPDVEVTAEVVEHRPELKFLLGEKLPVIAWVWARTVKSPNPAFSHVDVPLVSTFVLSSKEGREAYVHPMVHGEKYDFEIKTGPIPASAKSGTKLARGANFKCILSGVPIEPKYIKNQATKGKMGVRLLGIVADSRLGRVCLAPTPEHESAAMSVKALWRPELPISGSTQYIGVKPYGMERFDQIFTERQLTALNTFSDLVSEVIEKVNLDAKKAGLPDDGRPLREMGCGARAYAEAISLYLAFAVDYAANYWSTLATPADGFIRGTYSMQALPMSWDFAEAPPFGSTSGNWMGGVEWVAKAVAMFPKIGVGVVEQQNASTQKLSKLKVVSTDPPYYDNVPYADLSDYFYVWLRRSLRTQFPDLFATVAVPKSDELVAFAYRHQDGKSGAEAFFLGRMTEAMKRIAEDAHPAFPVTIYYAFKQAESEGGEGTSSTGWETFLDAVIHAGFSICGTWPMRTERGSRNRSIDSNALASSIILVCRKRSENATSVGRREFIRELNAILPEALDEMTRGGVNSPVAPVDLSQAIIGPGMAIFSQYAAVLEADGTPMRVKTALQLINRFLAEDDFDNDTQFCLHWFEQKGWATGRFGEADVLARAKGTSVAGLQTSGVVASGKGELRLLRWTELPRDWSPESDTRLPVWEALHHLIRALNQEGESGAGALLARMPAHAEPVRALAYRLYTLCERKSWAEEARGYNELVTAWSAIEQAAGEAGIVGSQTQLDI